MRIFLTILGLFSMAFAQTTRNPFQPFAGEWPTPTESRLASGAPGPAYWQQRADYDMDIELDAAKRRISGSATITYYNESPHALDYLWLQLDQDIRDPQSIAQQIEGVRSMASPNEISSAISRNQPFPGGLDLSDVKDAQGQVLKTYRGETNLRIDLPQALPSGQQFSFSLSWSYALNDATVEGRSGFEYFPDNNDYIFEVAQFFPRMCAYDDLLGWQNRPFYGAGEFALEFGDYSVDITVPDNFVVAATGELQNAEEVLDSKQMKRLAEVRSGDGEPAFIITPKEAEKNAASKSRSSQTWRYQARNVRDFAFAASKKFIWDAAAVDLSGRQVIAQSLYPPEAMPLWDTYATHAVIHTLKVYSQYSLDYPYPHATAIHGPVWGMEYPMISFCGGRPSGTGYYSRSAKYRMIGVVIHEVGHNFFPMVVNSDERRWGWMDEGLNSYLEYLTERTWEPDFPHRRGPADAYAFQSSFGYHDPIMSNVESIRDNGLISYSKTAMGLNMLRELIMGPEAFDYAFRSYAQRWAFKRPRPADFFRTMEDASGQDLEWFWRGWFYSTAEPDYSIKDAVHYQVAASADFEQVHQTFPQFVSPKPDAFYIDGKSQLKDKYTNVEAAERRPTANDKELKRLVSESKTPPDAFHIYHITVQRGSEVILPLVIDVAYADGQRESYKLPAQIWFGGKGSFTFEFRSARLVSAFQLDGQHLFPDKDRSDNLFPQPSKKRVFTEVNWQ